MTDTKATPKEGSVHPCCGKHFCSCTLEEIFAAFRRCEDRGLEAVRERDTWKELAQSAERRLSDSQKRPTLVCGTCGGNDRPDCEGDVKHAQDCAFGGELTNLHDAIQSMTDELSECNRAIPDTPEFDFLAGKTLPECVEALVNSFSDAVRERDDLAAKVYVPGLWRCAKCKLYLTASLLCASTGAIAADAKPQGCPNGCGPMWRVTEREERRDAQRSFNDLFDKERASVSYAELLAGLLNRAAGKIDMECDDHEFVTEIHAALAKNPMPERAVESDGHSADAKGAVVASPPSGSSNEVLTGRLRERAERMRHHILTKVVDRVCDFPTGKWHRKWRCGLCGMINNGPSSGERPDLDAMPHEADCMVAALAAAPEPPRGDVKPGHQATCGWWDGKLCTCGGRIQTLPQMGRSRGAEDIAAERARQMSVEGWTPSHDDAHGPGVMAQAAVAYTIIATEPRDPENAKVWWPWDWSWWKPRDPRRNLVRAGALIAAEIDRLDRAAKTVHET